MNSPLVPLPRGRHYALTTGLSDSNSGMASRLLQRSRAFARLGAEVEILTLDARPDYPQLAERLEQRRVLVEGMTIVNVWDWMREYRLPSNAPGTLRLGRHHFTPLRFDRSLTSRYRGETELSRTRYADDGTTVLQTDHYRLDGSLLLSERHDARRRGTPGGQSIVLCDAEGQPLRSWGSMTAFYRYWLDRMRRSMHSYLIVDDQVSAQLACTYRRKYAVVAHAVHESPLAAAGESFENLGDCDLVVFDTARQRDDAIGRYGMQPNFVVIPDEDAPGDSYDERMTGQWAREFERASARKVQRPQPTSRPLLVAASGTRLVSV